MSPSPTERRCYCSDGEKEQEIPTFISTAFNIKGECGAALGNSGAKSKMCLVRQECRENDAAGRRKPTMPDLISISSFSPETSVMSESNKEDEFMSQRLGTLNAAPGLAYRDDATHEKSVSAAS